MEVKKKPAHEVIVDMVRYAIRTFETDRQAHDETNGLILSGMLGAELEILKQMYIPIRHRKEVFVALKLIKSQSSLELIDNLIPESTLSAIASQTDRGVSSCSLSSKRKSIIHNETETSQSQRG